MSGFKNLVGKKFNSFTVLRLSHIEHTAFYLCRCDCGKELIIKGTLISRKSKPQKSCNECYQKRRLLHGMTNTKEFFAWRGILSRCGNPNDDAYSNYGGRGIKVCERWKEFKNFYEDMGLAPSKKHSLDRKENNKGYYKDNCRWVVMKVQQRNKRNNYVVEYNGDKKCLSEWAEVIGICHSTLYYRLKRGWDIEKTFCTPIKK